MLEFQDKFLWKVYHSPPEMCLLQNFRPQTDEWNPAVNFQNQSLFAKLNSAEIRQLNMNCALTFSNVLTFLELNRGNKGAETASVMLCFYFLDLVLFPFNVNKTVAEKNKYIIVSSALILTKHTPWCSDIACTSPDNVIEDKKDNVLKVTGLHKKDTQVWSLGFSSIIRT